MPPPPPPPASASDGFDANALTDRLNSWRDAVGTVDNGDPIVGFPLDVTLAEAVVAAAVVEVVDDAAEAAVVAAAQSVSVVFPVVPVVFLNLLN